MENLKEKIKDRKEKLRTLLESKSKANCDTRHLSAADIQREEEIEDLEDEIAALEKKL